ncbi:carbohydrate binding domain-containing protein [Hyalangium gracile]|uniref:carbohydrate binding domain-containing protein n=1 Tax=Hyalangium gracile TaxID=394092 RepID=UPI001CCB26CC|nr:carbohydrate binding domain-containing protein [Hyalangium gracile]
MTLALRKHWWLGVLALGMGSGCREPQPPLIGPNLVVNGSFEAGLEGWWHTTNVKEGTASVSAEAADFGSAGLKLKKGTEGWGCMAGQETLAHRAGQTFQVNARLKGAAGGERVTFSFHGQGFEVVAENRWRTVSRMLLLPEANSNATALISVTTNEATVYVDEVSIAQAVVEKGDADEEEDNLLSNGSFESDLGMWNFWTNSPDGSASTSPDARHSGFLGMVLTRGAEGAISSVKQPLRDPVAEREEYRIEARIRGTQGGEMVNLCLQMNDEPWDGPCETVSATTEWQHVTKKIAIEEALFDERVGAVLSLGSEGTVMVDDVIVVRTRRGY